MKLKNKLFSAFLALFLVLTMVGGMTSTVGAEEETQFNVVLHKRHNLEDPGVTFPNTGEEMDFGGDALPGVEFTAYDVTEEYYAAIKGKDQDAAIKAIQKLYTPVAPEGITGVQSATTDADGIATISNLDIKDVNGNYKVYVFVETKTPLEPTVMVKATPIVIAMPIYTLNQDGTNSDTVNNNIHLYPKNVTALDEKIFTNPGEFAVVDVNGEKYFNITTGSVLDFKVNLNIPTDISEKTEYSLTDNPTVGLEFFENSLKVNGLTVGEDYTFTENVDNGGFKISFNMKSEKFLKLAGSVLVVEYKMTLTAEVLPDELQSNKATISVDNNPRTDLDTKTDPENPEFPEIPEFFTNGHKFVKQDAQTGNALEGAEFIVGNGKGEFAKFTVNLKGEYVFVSWTTKEEDATRLVSNDKGEFSVIGLTRGDYILKETKAPSDKYVKIDGDIDFEVKDGYATSELQAVLNHPKGLLPSTGGNGIYAYLAVGSVMMLGALIWFKRSNKEVAQ